MNDRGPQRLCCDTPCDVTPPIGPVLPSSIEVYGHSTVRLSFFFNHLENLRRAVPPAGRAPSSETRTRHGDGTTGFRPARSLASV